MIRPAGRGAGNDRVAPVRISDVAQVVDGTADQTEIVRVNGSRGVYFRVQKQPGANTVDVVDQLRKALPDLRGIPPSVKLTVSFDQSAYIRAAISSLRARGALGQRPRHPGDPDLPGQLVGHRDHRRRHPALHRGHLRAALLLRPDAQRLHAGWPGPGRGAARRRLDRGAGEHPPPPGDGRRPRGARCWPPPRRWRCPSSSPPSPPSWSSSRWSSSPAWPATSSSRWRSPSPSR